MKFNFAIAALLASAQAARFSNEDKLQRLQRYELVQTESQDVLEHKGYFDGWHASMEDFPGTINNNGAFKQAYNRNIPGVFAADAAESNYYPVDQYTQKLITNDAIEGVDKKKCKGTVAQCFTKGEEMRTNKFFLTKADAKVKAVEILGTHFGMSGAEANTWLDAGNFEDAWNYWDVLGAGKVDAVGS